METNYWDKKAPDYDNHQRKSKNAYVRIIDLIKDEVKKSQILLDIGTGTGEIPIALSDHVKRIIATDYSPEMINIANLKVEKLKINNIIFQVQDCCSLGYNDEMFDVIIASNVLHIIEKPEQFLNSVKRLLKKDGKLIIPTFLHNESFKTKIISKILKFKGHPINTKFDSMSFIDFIEKCDYTIEKSVFIENIMPLLFIVSSKNEKS
jgi:phosphatidylethanolamine/phosphatidyl-N-methylethanolamine N-methyltransferase